MTEKSNMSPCSGPFQEVTQDLCVVELHSQRFCIQC